MRLNLMLFTLLAPTAAIVLAQAEFEHSNYKPVNIAQVFAQPVPAKETRLFASDVLYRVSAHYTGDTRTLDFPRHPLIPLWLNTRPVQGMSPKGLAKEMRLESEGKSFWAPVIMVVNPDKGDAFAIRRRSVVYLHQIGNLNGQPYFLAIVGNSESR
jgi:hypothetical protein